MNGYPGEPPVRSAWADALKGLLILLVVFWHVVLKTYLQIDWRIGVPIPGAWGLASDFIWPFLMPLFLVISGYFAANALARPWAIVFRTRVVRFLYLYLLWTLIHMVTMWAFPDFPTFVPRSVADFIEAVTISPPNTWYLYALAVYFLVAKGLRRLPRWLLIGGAAAVSVTVSAGLIDVASNRGSLLYNLLFFLLGLYFAPQIGRLTARPRPFAASMSIAAYLVAFSAMRATGSETVPGVWLAVSLIGVSMGIVVAPLLPKTPGLGRGLTWLGVRTLPIYLIHMPVLALADVALVSWLSGARIAVQLAAAVLLPVVLTGVVVAVSTMLGHLIVRDRLLWLFDLPARRAAVGSARRGAPSRTRRRLRLGAAGAVLVLTAIGGSAIRVTAIPGCRVEVPHQSATHAGEVSIGATGDMLLYDVRHSVPADRGRGNFDDVRPWFTQDIVTGNLEQVISSDTGFDKCGQQADCLAFRSPPDAARHFAGFDLLNVANNHTGDFGPAGYANTRAHLTAAGVRTVGDRNEIACTQVGDITVAMVGFAPYDGFNRVTDLRHVRQVVRAAAEHADIVVVHAHMGAEGAGADAVAPGTEVMYGENRGDVIAFSHAAVDAGADLVLGHGPHVLRGMEFYRGRLIAYSLGNFGGGGVFGAEQSTRYGAYLAVRLRADGTMVDGRMRSVRFEHRDGRPVRDPDDRAIELIDERGRRDFPDTAAHIGSDGSITAHR
ncbi:CapA family protein [Agromyces sp. NPDC056379]|uniref:CapA family protein n=1 Tax=unclassified Agromyces TaxID=2639701 RepID=UPI0035D77E76